VHRSSEVGAGVGVGSAVAAMAAVAGRLTPSRVARALGVRGRSGARPRAAPERGPVRPQLCTTPGARVGPRSPVAVVAHLCEPAARTCRL
jgi:hypothetical protein